jgi:GTPase SAR1 family protein
MSKSVKSTFAFTSGKTVYDDLGKKFIKQKKAYVILGPPGVGKTTFVKKQKEKIWVDVDPLFSKLGVKWHQNAKNPVDMRLNYLRADYMLEQTKALGFCVIGALFWEFVPDAIVIPDLDTHKRYLKGRKNLNIEVVCKIRNLLKKKAKDFKIPIFKSCEEAAASFR